MNIKTLLDLFSDSRRFLEEAIADIPPTRAADQPYGAVNHPAWTMTHVCVANDFALELLGKPGLCPAAWGALAAPGSKPKADLQAYPSLAETRALLARQHDQIDAAVRAAPAAQFEQPAPEAIRSFAPTIGHAIAYMLVAHENYHLAQISMWKRVAGLSAT